MAQTKTIAVFVIDPVQGPFVQTIEHTTQNLQRAVGGDEPVTMDLLRPHQHKLGKDLDIWVDDDGLSKSLPVNAWSPAITGGFIVGRMVITRSKGAETVSLTPSDLERLNRMLPPAPVAHMEFVSWEDVNGP